MRRVFAYRRVRGPLAEARPWIAALYLFPLAFVAFAFANPVVLLAAGVGAIAVGLAAGVRESVLAPLRWSAGLVLLVVLVNGLVSQRGATILFRFGELPLLGPTNVTLEALAEGAVLGLRIVVSLLVFAVWSACVNPDRILRGARPFARHSALTATLISRLVPLAAADAHRLSEAARLRGPAAAAVGRTEIAGRLFSGALERSVEVAATLELRGYGLPSARRRVRNRRAPGEPGLFVAGVAVLAGSLAALAGGIASFEAYPLTVIDLDAATGAFALSIPVIVAAPALLGRVRGGRSDRGSRDG